MENQDQPQAPVLKYRDLISQSEGELQSEQLELNVQKSKSKLEMDIAQTKFDLAEANQRLNTAARRIPYDVTLEIKVYEEIIALEAGLAYAEKVLSERF